MTNADQPTSDDEDPFITLVEEHADTLQRFISARVRGDLHAIEDITQESFGQLWAYHNQRGPLAKDELARILYTIARRRISDWYKE